MGVPRSRRIVERAPRVRTIQVSNLSFKNSPPLSNCQVFNLMLPFLADINCSVFLQASSVSSAVLVLSRVMTTSSEISSTTVRTRSEWRCSPVFPSGCRFVSFPWFSALCFASRQGLHSSLNFHAYGKPFAPFLTICRIAFLGRCACRACIR
jgi:hypothetical protein